MFAELLPSIRMLLVVSVLTGALYPLLITAAGQFVLQGPANGSLIVQDGKVVGSELIGQAFDDPKYFWSRPSATTPQPYNAAASSGSNQGARNPALTDAVTGRIKALHDADPDAGINVPVDLVTASGSGLDPHISVAAALYQVARVAKARGLNEQAVRAQVDANTEERTFGILGEPRVSVLKLNLALQGAH